MDIAIIGGGAAGFFSAIHAKVNYPDSRVVIFEKSQKILAKVKISGGGKCNVTNACSSINELCNAYPRGGKSLKKPFHIFSTGDTIEWFESHGVPLFIREDQHVFPVSQNSQSIVDCLVAEINRLNIELNLGAGIKSITKDKGQLLLNFEKEANTSQCFDKVIVATGGSPKRSGLEWLEDLGHQITDPVPSLFTFNMPTEVIIQLQGIAVENASVNIQGTKLKSKGPLLITHWGMSGPAILKLSAFGARILSELNYYFKIQINWIEESNHELIFEYLQKLADQHPKKILANIKPYSLPERLWLFLLEKCDIPADKKWLELGKKSINKLASALSNDIYEVNGKTTFKEEFVTSGGVSLQSIDLNTMQSKLCKNLYFAGEVIDIDAITGGYNFQAAWTTGFIAGKLN